nr:unnamed protein product [Digitaria exilis]
MMFRVEAQPRPTNAYKKERSKPPPRARATTPLLLSFLVSVKNSKPSSPSSSSGGGSSQQRPQGGMGGEKRKARDRQRRSRTSSEPSITDPQLEVPDQMGNPEIVGGGDSDRADGDPPMQDVNPTGNVGDDLDEGIQGRSAYLVACHFDWASNPNPYAVYKVSVATASPSRMKRRRKRLHRITRLATVAGGKTFTSVRSVQRSWIIGVGGDAGDAVIFDTKTEEVIHGPSLNSAKWCPAMTAVGDKVYALSKTPSWVADPDFPPWFEVLDLSNAKVVTVADRSHLEGCSWSQLPHPPCFPWKIRPIGYTVPLIVILRSYVVIDRYILVSFNHPWGTYAFDTSSVDPYEWHKVGDERLPFIGNATPHGSLFLGLSKDDGPINAYRINVTASVKDQAPNLSITVLPVKYMGHELVAGPCFFSLEDGCFCSFSFSLDSRSITLDPNDLKLFPKVAHITITTYQTENPSSLGVSEETLLPLKPEVLVCSQWEQAFKISCSSHGFSPSAYTLLSI